MGRKARKIGDILRRFKGEVYAYQSVEVDQPRRTISLKRAFVDLGVINIITAWIECEIQYSI